MKKVKRTEHVRLIGGPLDGAEVDLSEENSTSLKCVDVVFPMPFRATDRARYRRREGDRSVLDYVGWK